MGCDQRLWKVIFTSQMLVGWAQIRCAGGDPASYCKLKSEPSRSTVLSTTVLSKLTSSCITSLPTAALAPLEAARPRAQATPTSGCPERQRHHPPRPTRRRQTRRCAHRRGAHWRGLPSPPLVPVALAQRGGVGRPRRCAHWRCAHWRGLVTPRPLPLTPAALARRGVGRSRRCGRAQPTPSTPLPLPLLGTAKTPAPAPMRLPGHGPPMPSHPRSQPSRRASLAALLASWAWSGPRQPAFQATRHTRPSNGPRTLRPHVSPRQCPCECCVGCRAPAL